MKSLSKFLGLSLLGLLILVVGAGFALTQLLDPNDYKDEIRGLVQDKTGYDLQIDGPIGWSLFPWLGLELTDTRLALPDSDHEPFARVRLLALSVQVLPLLQREIRMSDIRIEGLDLSLVRDTNGKGNWETRETPVSGSTTSPSPTPPTDDSPIPAIKLEIDSLIVNSARLDYSDEQSGQQLTLESVQISTGAISDKRNIPLKLSGFLASNQPLLRARMEMSASVWMDGDNRQYRLDGLKIAGEIAGEPLNNKSANISANGNLLLDLNQQQLAWQQLRFSANQLKGMGELQIDNLNSSTDLSGRLSLAAFSLRDFLPGIGVELPAMQNKTALGHFELNSEFQGSADRLMLNNATLRLDDSTLKGELGVSSLAKGRIRLHMAGDRLNLDHYLPPATSEKSPAPASSGQNAPTAAASSAGNPWDDGELLPVARLANLDLDIALQMQQLTLQQMPFEQSSLRLQARNGKLDLQEFKARLFGGNLDLNASLDSQSKPPRLSFNARTSQLPVEKVMAALGEEAPVTGKLQLDSRLTTSGNSQRQWVSRLDGQSSFEIRDGTLPDSNLEQQLCMGIATLNRKSLSQDYSRNSTPFNQLKGSARFNKGIANTPDLRLAIPGLLVKGKGDLDLNKMALDYRLGLILEGDTRPMPDPACTVNKRYVGLEWPLHCNGPLAEAGQSCRLDQDGLGKLAGKLAGDKITEKLEEKLKDKVSPDLKDALKGLLKK